MSPRLDYWKTAPQIASAVLALNTAVENSGLDRGLLHLIKLRASQINGCAFCIDMHTREARADGDSEQRLYLVSAWQDSPLFSEREKAALAWTESLTRIADSAPGDALYDRVSAVFDPQEVVNLTVAIGVINVWNRLAISFRTPHPMPDAQAA